MQTREQVPSSSPCIKSAGVSPFEWSTHFSEGTSPQNLSLEIMVVPSCEIFKGLVLATSRRALNSCVLRSSGRAPFVLDTCLRIPPFAQKLFSLKNSCLNSTHGERHFEYPIVKAKFGMRPHLSPIVDSYNMIPSTRVRCSLTDRYATAKQWKRGV